MNTIEFNKNYTKLPDGIKTATLIACEPVKGENQVTEFIQYDTESKLTYAPFYDYWRNLRGDYLLLCLISDTGAFFTHQEPDNAENREKYMKYSGYNQTVRYGKEFQIIIKEG